MLAQERHKSDMMKSRMNYMVWMFIVATAIFGTTFMSPDRAEAFPTKFQHCINCHTWQDLDASIDIEVWDGSGTSTGSIGSPATVTVAASTWLDIDYLCTNTTQASKNAGTGYYVAVPAGWTVQGGNTRTPTIGGWNSIWDQGVGIDALVGVGAAWSVNAAGTPDWPGVDSYTVDFQGAGSSYSVGSRGAVCDDADVCDPDGTADLTGTDLRVQVGSASGTVYINCIGHDLDGNKNTKSYATAQIDVTISAGDVTPPTTSNILVTANESGTYVGDPFDMSGDLTDNESTVSSCQYCIKNGSECTSADTWAAGSVSGLSPTWTCSAIGVAAYTAGGGFTDADSIFMDVRGTSSGGQNDNGGTALNRTMDKAATMIADLGSSGQTANSVTLTWSNPVDGGSGNASFDVRYVAGATFIEGQWAGANDPGSEPVPPTTGMTVGSLSASTQYTFAIKTTDNLGNQAVISNTVTVTTDAGADVTPPTTSNILVTLNESGTYAGDPFNMSGDLTDNESAVASCQYCIKNGSECTSADTWSAGSLSGSSPTWTCSATGVAAYTAGGGFTDADSIFIDVRGTSTGGQNDNGGTALNRTMDKAATAIADLASSGNTGNSVDLTWSDPVDGGSGNASYDVRYVAGATFIEGQWAGASDPGGEPTPATTGMTVGSLSPSTQYTFAIKTTDNLGNQAAISNTVTVTTDAAPDVTPPTTSNILVTLNESGLYAGDPFNMSGDLTDNESAVSSCQYCIKNGSECISTDTWAAGSLSGSSPTWTCSATGVAAYTAGGGFTDADSIYIDVRGTSTGGQNDNGGTALNRTMDKAATAIADLASSGNTSISVDLTWSDPVDGGSGNASYDVRYVAGATFIEGQWAGANDPGGEPTPATTGMTVGSLSASTQYTFAIKTTDNLGNQAAISNTVTVTTDPPPDGTAPTTSNIIVTANESGTYVGDPFNMSGDLTDAESTVSSCQYCIKNGSECANADTWTAGALSGSSPTWTCSATGVAAYTAGGGFTDADSIYMDVRGTSLGGTNIDGGTSLIRTMDKAAATIADLGSSGQTANSVTLTWSDPVDGGSGNASFDVRYVTGATFLEAQWAGATDPGSEPVPPATGMTVGTLSASTQYTFAIKTTDNLGNQAAISNTVTVTTDDGTVPVTSNILVTLNESGIYVGDPFDMSGDVTDAESAVVSCEYCVKNGSECGAADTWTAGALSGLSPTWTCSASGVATYTAGGGFTDTDSIYIDVRGTSSAGTNNDGGTSLNRTVDKAAPAAIADLASPAQDDTTVDLTWTDPADVGAGNASYDVRYVAGATFLEAQWAGASDPGSEPSPPTGSMTVTTLSPLTQYTFAIKTTDNVTNQSVISNTVTVTTTGDSNPPVIGTITPQNVDDGSFVDGTFDLTAAVTEANTVTGCEYCVAIDGTCDTEWAAGAVGGSAPNWTCTQTGLTGYGDTTVLTLNIRADDDATNQGTGTPVSRTVDSSPPAAVADLAAPTNTHDTVDLTWANPSDGTGSGNASFDVRYVTGASFIEGQWAGATDPGGEPVPPSTGVSVTSLSSTTQYTFAIKTTDNVTNQSVISNTVTVTTDGAPDLTDPTAAVTAPTEGQTLNLGDSDPFTISGTADDNVNVQQVDISINGGAWTPAICTGCGTTSATWTYSWPLVDGAYTIQARATDAAANTGLSTIINASVDITAPSVAPQVINIMDTGELTGHAWTEQTALPATVLPDDVQEIIITLDTMTGVNPTDTADLWVDDISIIYVPDPAPISTISDPTEGAYLNAASSNPYTVSGAATDNTSVQKIEISIDGGIWNDAVCVGCGTSSATWTYSWTLPADGPHTIESRATDSSGNVESPSLINVTVDITDPTSSVINPVDSASLNAGQFPYTIDGSATDAIDVAGIEVSPDGGNNWYPTSCVGCGTTSATWTYSWANPGNGAFTIQSRATDAAGNIETPSAGNSVTVDAGGPSVLSTSPADAQPGVTIDSNVTITFDSNDVDCATVTTGTVTSNNPNWTKFDCQNDQPVGGQTLATFTTTGQTGSTQYTVTVSTSVQDLSGNPAVQYVFSYTTEDSNPPTSILTDPAGGAVLNSGTPTTYVVTGTASDDVTVSSIEVGVDGSWSAATCTGCPGTEVSWTYSWAWTSETEGAHTVQSRATDSSSNVETPAAGSSVTIDSVVPTSAISVPAVDPIYLNSSDFGPNYTISGTGSDTAPGVVQNIEVSTDGGNSWTNAVCTGCGTSNVTWTHDWSDPGIDDSYTIKSRAIDDSGNTQASVSTVAVYDNTAPTVTSTSPADTATEVALNSNVTITWDEDIDCSTVNTTNITSDSPGWTLSICTDPTDTATFTTSGQSNGATYNLNVTTAVADKAGNAMASAYPFSYTTVAPNTAPGVPSLTQYKSDGSTVITQGNATNETVVVIKGTVSDPDADTVQLQVEFAVHMAAYANTPTCASDFVTSGTTATAICSGLSDNTDYMWQFRTYDGTDYNTGGWQDFVGATDIDVSINTDLELALMLHNSSNMGSAKWSGDGGWGLAGTKYGEFVCATCHTDNTTNIKRVRTSITTPDNALGSFPGDGQSVVFLDPREGTSHFGDDNGGHSTSNRICEMCHSITSYHRYNTSGQSQFDHNNQLNCTRCHYHYDGFIPQGGDCVECHKTGGSGIQVQAEFERNSHHIQKNWVDIKGEDCVVCHAEGTPNGDGTANRNSAYHNNPIGVIDLYDGQNRGTIYSVTKTLLEGKDDATNTTLDTFCMSCHRDGGANAITGTAGGWSSNQFSARNPFGETTNIRTNSYDTMQKFFNKSGGGLAVWDDMYPGTGAGFDSQDNHHPVRGPRYTTNPVPGPRLRDLGFLSSTVALFSGQTGISDFDTIHCTDCHSTAYSGHGGNNEYMLQTATSENPSAEHASEDEYVCNKCHINGNYPNGSGNHTGNGGDLRHTSDQVGGNRVTANSNGHRSGIGCLNCHDGNVGWGGIHGFEDATYLDDEGATYNKRRFLPGASQAFYDPDKSDGNNSIPDDEDWEIGPADADQRCITIGAPNSMTGCDHHSGSGTNHGARNLQRNVDY